MVTKWKTAVISAKGGDRMGANTFKKAFSKIINTIKNYAKKAANVDAYTSSKYRYSKKIVNRKRFVISCCAIAAVLVVALYIVFAGRAYTVKVNGVAIGKVKTKKSVETAVQTLKQKFQDESGSNINLISEISFEKSRASSKELLKDSGLVEALSKNVKYSVQACTIYVDSKPVATLKTKADAEAVLKEVQKINFVGEDMSKVKEIGFAEKVETKEEFVDADVIADQDEVLTLLTKGTTEIKTHTVESGDTFWTIAKKNNMTVKDLEKANPGVNSEKIKIGQVINLVFLSLL